jgi:hypothetical protein
MGLEKPVRRKVLAAIEALAQNPRQGFPDAPELIVEDWSPRS